MGSVSKLQARGMDRVSALPDPVLCRILSFIPTIDSVKTTILSRRWKNLWTFVPNLDLDDADYCDTIWFSRYVDRVLFFRDSTDIHTFLLHSYTIEDFSRIDGWIATALKRNVVELDLCVESNEERTYELPKILLLCKTLMDLRLRSNFIINPPTSACLPSLKSLRVDIVHPNNNSMEKLFSSLPVLEHLHIYVSEPELLPGGDAATNLTISHPGLKTLRIHWFNTHGYYEKCSFFIATPKLEHLDLSQYVLIDSFLEDANSLVRANISFDHHSGNEGHRFTIRATALLAGLSNVKYLSLSSHNLKGCCLPVFDNLRKLELLLHFCYHWKLTTEMLKRSRNLEYLALTLCGYVCVKSSERQWNPPEHVPPCLLSHLKTISIMGFQGKLDEMEAAKYFLKNGKVMKKMTIQTHNLPCTKEELHKGLLFQRASKACQVEII